LAFLKGSNFIEKSNYFWPKIQKTGLFLQKMSFFKNHKKSQKNVQKGLFGKK